MKTVIGYILCFVCLLSWGTIACAEEHGDRYIVKTNTSSLMLLSDDTEGLRHIGNGLYVAESYEEAQKFMEAVGGMYMFPDEELELLDYPETTSDKTLGWHMETMRSDLLRQKGLNGAGVTIAVVDSGLEASHPDLAGVKILPGYNVMEDAEDQSNTDDVYGHGTMVSGVIAAATDNGIGTAGLADGVSILPIKVSDGKSLTYADFYSGMQTAIGLDCDVINVSIGGSLSYIAAREVKKLMKQAESKGKIVVAAAGNDGNATLMYPAAVDTVIGVGSVNQSGVVSTFSQKNNSVWITAPGEGIHMLYHNGGYATGQGTSFSAPMITAIAAIVRQIKPSCTPEEFRTLLKNTATDRGAEGYDTSFGYGVVNVEGILDTLSAEIPPFLITYGMDKNKNPAMHLHNNTGAALPYRGFFASYNGKQLSHVAEVTLKDGVTTVPTAAYDRVFFWDDALKPARDSLDLKQ